MGERWDKMISGMAHNLKDIVKDQPPFTNSEQQNIGGGMSNVTGTWYNFQTQTSIFIHDMIHDGEKMLAITNKGNFPMSDLSNQGFVFISEEMDENKAMTKYFNSLNEEVKDNRVESSIQQDNNGILKLDNRLQNIHSPVIKNEIQPVEENPLNTRPQEQKNVVDFEIIERLFKNINKQPFIINYNIDIPLLQNKEINDIIEMLSLYMNISNDSIVSYIMSKYVKVEDIQKTIYQQLISYIPNINNKEKEIEKEKEKEIEKEPNDNTSEGKENPSTKKTSKKTKKE